MTDSQMTSTNTQRPYVTKGPNKPNQTLDRTTLLIIALVVVISISHYFLQPIHAILHNLLQRLYYVPIVLAAYKNETKGAVKTALLCGLLYSPHILITWKEHQAYQVNQFLEIVLFLGVGYLAGVLFQQKNNTAEILQKYQKMAQFGELSRSVIRSLKAPLKTIKGMLIALDESKGSDDAIGSTVEIINNQVNMIEQLRKDLISLVSRKHLRLKKLNLNSVVMKFTEQIEHQLNSHQILLSRTLESQGLEALLNAEAIIDSLHSLVSWMLIDRRNIDKITVYTGATSTQIWTGITVDNMMLPSMYQGDLNYLPKSQQTPTEILKVLNVMNNHFGEIRFRLKERTLREFILVFPKRLKLPRQFRDN